MSGMGGEAHTDPAAPGGPDQSDGGEAQGTAAPAPPSPTPTPGDEGLPADPAGTEPVHPVSFDNPAPVEGVDTDEEDDDGMQHSVALDSSQYSPTSRLVDIVPTDTVENYEESVRVRQSRSTSLMRSVAAGMADESAAEPKTKQEQQQEKQEQQPEEEEQAAEEDPVSPSTDPKLFRQKWLKVRKHIFIFSDAARPIFTRFGDETEFIDFFGMMGLLVELTSNTFGATARMDVAQSRGSRTHPTPAQLELKYIKAGSRTYVVMKRQHLVFVVSSATGESVAVLTAQLEFLYSVLLSILTASLHKIFEKRANYDLRGLLGDSAVHMFRGAIRTFNNNPGFGLGSIPVLRVRRTARDTICKALRRRLLETEVDPEETPYAFLLYHVPEGKAPYGGKAGSNSVLLVSYVSGDRTPVSPKDFSLLANFVQSSLPRTSKYQEMWAPCCLPDYNEQGYLYLYMTFITPTVSLVISSSRPEAFSSFREVKDGLVQDFGLTPRDRIAAGIPPAEPTSGPLHEVTASRPYSVTAVDVQDKNSPDEVLHFLYKDSELGQHTSCRFGPPFVGNRVQKELIRQYLKAREGAQTCMGAKKTVIYTTEHYVLLARIGKSYELYVAYKPLAAKPQISQWATLLKKWVRQHGDALFAPPLSLS